MSEEWPERGPYEGPILSIEEMWKEASVLVEMDNPNITPEQVKLSRESFYRAFGSVLTELVQFGHDPKAMMRAFSGWSREWQKQSTEMLLSVNSKLYAKQFVSPPKNN
jgi:hypothetical protein